MPHASIAAGVLVALAAASPCAAQGVSVTPFAWIEDATIVEPGSVSAAVSAIRWQGATASEVDIPVVDVAIGLTERVHLTASVPRVVGGVDAGGAIGGMGTSFFSLKVALLRDRRRGVKLSVSPTLEMLGDGMRQSIEPGERGVEFGLPVSVEVDRGGVRWFAGGGYFSRGVWFGGGGLGVRAGTRAFVSGNFSRSWRGTDRPTEPLSTRDRNDVSGSVSYALTPRLSVFGSAGHTLATLDANGAGATLGAGVALFLAPGRK